MGRGGEGKGEEENELKFCQIPLLHHQTISSEVILSSVASLLHVVFLLK
jgi:hypothetical protein